MTHRPLFLAAALTTLGFGITPIFASQMPGMQMPAVSQADPSRPSLDAEMMNHQQEMQTLLAKLQTSLQAIVDARDGSGYFSDKSIVRAHEADLTELRNAVRSHKLFLIDEERKCGTNSSQHDAMMQHQQQMKAVLYDVVDTFYTYMAANDRSNDFAESVSDALSAHRQALKGFGDAIAQHQQAMAQMMKKCPNQ